MNERLETERQKNTAVLQDGVKIFMSGNITEQMAYKWRIEY